MADIHRLVPGIHFTGAKERHVGVVKMALQDTPTNLPRSVYDLWLGEIVAMANPPAFFFQDLERHRLMTSNEILLCIDSKYVVRRVANVLQATRLARHDQIVYFGLYHFPVVGLTKMTAATRTYLGEYRDVRFVVSDLAFEFLG